MRFLIAILGTGTMGGSVATRLVQTQFPSQQIIVSNRSQEKLHQLVRELNIRIASSNAAAISEADVALLSIKPQMAKAVCEEIKEAVQKKNPLVVSLVTATPSDDIAAWLDTPNLGIIRTMPNTAIAIGEGVTAMHANSHVTPEQKEMAENIFSRMGAIHWVANEDELTQLTPLIGCGPAYVNLLEEAMIEAAISRGIPRKLAAEITLNVISGAIRLGAQSELSAKERRRLVTTPNGVTDTAIKSLEPEKLFEKFRTAFRAAVWRCKEIEVALQEQNAGSGSTSSPEMNPDSSSDMPRNRP